MKILSFKSILGWTLCLLWIKISCVPAWAEKSTTEPPPPPDMLRKAEKEFERVSTIFVGKTATAYKSTAPYIVEDTP